MPSSLLRSFLTIVTLFIFSSPTIAQETDQDVPVGAVGGSVHADLFTGTATTSIPIEVPPGRGGVQPELALVYGSANGNGWIGMGWKLEKGVIERQTKFGVDYSGDDYVFRLSGINVELVNIGTDEYRAKIEGGFTKVEKLTATDGKPYFMATDKTGKKFYFGQEANTRVADPADANRIFRWCLDRVEDPNGNYMTLTYTSDQGQSYQARVDYTGNGVTAPSNSVIFHLEDRPDVTPMYVPNFEMTNAKRLKTIEVQAANGTLVRAYKLTYATGGNTNRSLLSSVQQFGQDATIDGSGTITGGTALPAVTLNYQDTNNGFDQTQYPLGFAWSNTNVHVQGDFNGDGKGDFLIADTTTDGGIVNPNTRTYAYLSDGDGTFTQVAYSLNLGWNNSAVQAQGDFNGDGKGDFLITDADSNGRIINPDTRTYTYLSNGDGTFTQVAYSLNLAWAGGDIHAQGDFNGDGKSDFLLTDTKSDGSGRIVGPNTHTHTYLSNGDGTFTQVAYSLNLGWNNTAVQTQGDFNGDGLGDFLLTDATTNGAIYNPNTRTYTYLSNGDGTFTQVLYSLNLGWNNADVQAQGDYNGDGKVDFLITDANSTGRIIYPDTRTYTYLSNGDGTFMQVAYSLNLGWGGVM